MPVLVPELLYPFVTARRRHTPRRRQTGPGLQGAWYPEWRRGLLDVGVASGRLAGADGDARDVKAVAAEAEVTLGVPDAGRVAIMVGGGASRVPQRWVLLSRLLLTQLRGFFTVSGPPGGFSGALRPRPARCCREPRGPPGP